MYCTKGSFDGSGRRRCGHRGALPVAKGVDFGVEYGPEKYFVCWWDKVELDAFARAFAPLARER
jgi:hypothetical protein